MQITPNNKLKKLIVVGDRVMADEDDVWKGRDEQVKYIPLQAKEGDLAIFLQSASTEVIFQNEKYFIVPQSAVLMPEREEDL